KSSAVATPCIKSGGSSLSHSMTSILAPGAMACAHSTSIASSTSELPLGWLGPAGSAPGKGAGSPCSLTTIKNDDEGPYRAYNVGPEDVRPNCWSNPSTSSA